MSRLLAAVVVLPALASGAARAAESLEPLARAHRTRPTAATRAALMRYAAAHPKDSSGALARLVAGTVGLARREPAQALADLAGLAERLPALADYAALGTATALFETRQFEKARRALEPVWKTDPVSPLRGKAAILAARSDIERGAPAAAAAVLAEHAEHLPQPEGALVAARALEAKGEAAGAALEYQRVYFEYPFSPEAEAAGSALSRLRLALGGSYPEETAEAVLERARKLAEAGDFARARRELAAAAEKLSGAGRDLARVRTGAVDYLRREEAAAYRYLLALELPPGEADAERLYWLVACSRRLNNEQAMAGHQAELARRYPASRWRLQALITEANHHLLNNRPASYTPLYRACADAFPDQPQAAYCHWKVVWAEYMARSGQAAALLQEHLRRFPGSDKRGAALYYLGRLAEDSGDRGSAAAYYAEASARLPNSYYGTLARERLTRPEIRSAPPPSGVKQLLAGIRFPPPPRRQDFEPAPPARKRIERARLLESAALDDWAAAELRFAARSQEQPQAMALELARLAARRGAYAQGIRHIKAVVPEYLLWPLEAAPQEFWKLAFPIPYRATLDKYALRRKIDPFLFAALVRQESEFDPKAVSRARALGLAQILPSTGRQLARKLGIRRFTRSMLFVPEVNLNLGAYILRTHLDHYGGRIELALAAYNAGKSRADAWSSWNSYREPAEFIETIPFSETRTYVQAVLRNAEVYRRLYGEKPSGAVSRK